MTQASWDAPFERLRAGEIDLMAAWLPLEQGDLVVGPVLTEQPRALAMARDHPLAGRDSVDVEELAEQRILSFDNWPRELRETITPSTTPRGRPITRVRVTVGERSVSDVAVRVARGEVVYPTVASAAAYMGDMAFAQLTGMPALRSALVWRRPARDPKLRAFIVVARETLGQRSRSRRRCCPAATPTRRPTIRTSTSPASPGPPASSRPSTCVPASRTTSRGSARTRPEPR